MAEGEKQKISESAKPSFKEYGFDDRLLSALVRIGIKIPTNIQFDALPLLLSGKSGLIASETGNGKTVAFLLPTLQKILNSYEVSPDLTNRKYMSPLAVIATPGRELASQIKDVAEALCADLDINVRFMSYSKCSNWRRISKLLSNFGCLFTFYYLDGANSIKTDLHICKLRTGQFVSYKSVI